jgi:uncharacterized membrane protein
MSKKPLYLTIAAFNGADQAKKVLDEMPEGDRHFPTVVILVKDKDGQVTFKDMGKTPGKQAAKGVVLGAVMGVLTGGTGLALGALGGLAAHRSASKKQVDQVASLQLDQIAGSLGPDSSAIVGIGSAPLMKELVKAFEDRGGRVYETEIPADMVDHLDDYSDENYQLLLDSMAAETGG